MGSYLDIARSVQSKVSAPTESKTDYEINEITPIKDDQHQIAKLPADEINEINELSPDEIHQAVLLMAAHWQYTLDDLAYVLTDSASDPQGWLPILYAEGWLVKPTEMTRAAP